MRIALFPLNLVLFPGVPLQLHIFEERYVEMIGECLREGREFGIVRARQDGLAVVGCTAAILTVLRRYPDGCMDILCRGERRFEIESLHDGREFLQAEVDFLQDEEPVSTRREREECAALHMQMMELSGEDALQFPQIDLNGRIAFSLASLIPADLDFKQELLQLDSDDGRTQQLIEFYLAILPKLDSGMMAKRSATPSRQIM
jgi:Lon protease-like protein